MLEGEEGRGEVGATNSGYLRVNPGRGSSGVIAVSGFRVPDCLIAGARSGRSAPM